MSGLTSTGYLATTVEEEVDNLNALFLANVNAALDLDPDQPFGQVIAIFANELANLTELGATLYNAINPNAAEGQLLVNAAALTGTIYQVATYSYCTCTVNLNAGVTLTAGVVAAVAGQATNTWVLTANVTNSGGSPANVTAIFQSSLPGPFVANPGTLTVINTPTIGWNSITNAAAATEGLSADTDTTLRQRRELELQGQGSGDLDAIRAAVLKSDPNILSVYAYENTSLTTDANGVPGKAFHVVVWDGPGALASNAAIAAAIWATKPSGIQSYGTQFFVGTPDSLGNTQTVAFDRAIQVPLWVTCTTTPASLTGAQTPAVKAALAAYALATLGVGAAVIDLPFRAAALVPGVTTDVPTFAFDVHSSPTNTGNLPATVLQIYTLSTANILVNGV
jgi:uncharacterized phage protein gp47/JayE